ncbi:MAG: redoxin domain-containing protein [Chitinophaga sp.]|uniref:redoxin domain-containing protein n=1 Tax=Chitinophaga sp. TaxID=1869181 RepID=UPI0025C23929|nr:redoxin domain-containing protein [Chitinophaga sp.]MBV8255130.1 redoxin domain-containing protein [Chitinophaga sp.]
MSTLYRYADYLQQPVPENFPKTGYHKECISPVMSGIFPEFFLEPGQAIHDAGLLTQGASIHTLTAQPLVVIFYSIHWNGYADDLLEQVAALHPVIEAAGAKLLLVSSENRKQFEAVNQQPLSFDVVYDEGFQLAKKAGIYRKSDPIWGFVAGVNEDVPVPAVYVITPDLSIKYAFIDKYLEHPLQPADLLAAIESRIAISA